MTATDHPPHEDNIEALAALRWRTIGQQHYGDFDPETETRDLVAECKAEMADVWNYGNMLATAGTITAAQRDQLHRRLREAWAVVAASVAQGAGTARRGL